jgi:hypothetical protein
MFLTIYHLLDVVPLGDRPVVCHKLVGANPYLIASLPGR